MWRGCVRRASTLALDGREYARDEWTNVGPRILERVGRRLHLERANPLSLVRRAVRRLDAFRGVDALETLPPAVTVHANFDSLLVPERHPSRSPRDCYYLNRGHLLRAHTTAHLAELLREGRDACLVFGDVYRRDEIDSTHFPVFHQVDGFRTFPRERRPLVEAELKRVVLALARGLFGDATELRWVDAFFPFTHPSWELEALRDGQWTELLGCGVVRDEILQAAGRGREVAYAFGAGLERLAMTLYGVPDVRLFWSRDSGFLAQWEGLEPGEPRKYRPVSAFPQCVNDLAFWLPEGVTRDAFADVDVYEVVRDEGGDAVEQVTPRDAFVHPRTSRTSLCYRIVYRHMERTLTKDEVNRVHARIAHALADRLRVQVR